ncbi:hypothetical protein Desaci_1415 [Desulfosporosinus acidiphilus SJ4]|uniref:Staygreen protein domain-containing protein n=1 Tax=Desulfosporosinus acidiphilus (strain DSM 22704 / JCM 16185 / SJ4) TaxID=646529 RepID=I4D3R0_DESAJ|nr:staygreen family protein [Desulfosporosinus acidiphilus]AFM40434.1 hypothetical protein Desaci_1415 [Desulfosporosinus acidiphilus SJ4]
MKFNPEKLHIEFRNGITPIGPILGRRYTLTHSDVTAELFLTVGLTFAYDKINMMRDEVLGEWLISCNQCTLNAFCHVGGEMGKESARNRDMIFKRELRLALESIRYGDNSLFKTHPYLDESPIWINFNSVYSEYDRAECWGIFRDYTLGN